MSERKIYIRRDDGSLMPLEEQPFDTTNEFRELIGQCPELLRRDDETDVENADDFANWFWGWTATNLDTKRLRLLFVADEIPIALEQVVNFLNEHAREHIEVLAVEVKQYRGQSGQVLVSRFIGQEAGPYLGSARTGEALYCLCGCGIETKPGSRFAPGGHDMTLRSRLDKVKGGNYQIDGDLKYAAERCRNDSKLYCHGYTSAAIIQLAEKLEARQNQA